MERKKYQKDWIANKRARLKLQHQADLDTSHSNSSDSNDLCTSHAQFLQSSAQTWSIASADMPLQMHLSGASFDCSFNSTSDDSDSDSSEDCWNRVDKLCTEFSDSSDSEGESIRKTNVKSRLQNWAVTEAVTHRQLDTMLPILQEEYDSALPRTAKTLLKITNDLPSNAKILSGGEYLYLGVKAGLIRVLSNDAQLSTSHVIELTLNIDGLPLFRSSSYSLWPVLCCVADANPQQVFPVALYGGKNKPTNCDFLLDTIHELQELLSSGFSVNGKHFECKIKFIVCDAPAKAMVKCVKQYSGYFGCDKCCQKGEYVGRMTYPECEAQVRDNTSFRSKSNADHHTGTSHFCELPIDMIKCFPVDYMHQTCLGVMKRLLACWTEGTKKCKLSLSQKAQINTRLQIFRTTVTSEFNRKPRTLNELPHWKATEFRTFLLYTGYFVLHKIMNDDVLEHFRTLVIALRILTSEKLAVDCSKRTFAHQLLLYFVSRAVDIYGPEFLVYNVHCLVHLADEVERFGQLDNCSAFVFENYMQTMKKYVRSAKSPLVQVTHRLEEHNLYSEVLLSQKNIELCELHLFSAIAPNNACLIGNEWCCQVVNKGPSFVTCMLFKHSEPVFNTPVDSRVVGIHKVEVSSGFVKRLPFTTLAHKALCYTGFKDGCLVFIKLLHTV
jgi:hypothetical protein